MLEFFSIVPMLNLSIFSTSTLAIPKSFIAMYVFDLLTSFVFTLIVVGFGLPIYSILTLIMLESDLFTFFYLLCLYLG